MGKFIYTNDLPMYEKYELIDIYDYLSGGLNLTSRSADTLFIKGINKKNRPKETIKIYDFQNEYRELGKNLFELVYKKHKIKLKYTYIITEKSDLKERYIQENFFELANGLGLEESNLLSSISSSLNALAYLNELPYIDTKLNKEIINKGQEIIDNLIILYGETGLDIYDYLYNLNDIIISEIKLLDKEIASILLKAIFEEEQIDSPEIKEIQAMCVDDLTLIFDELDEKIQKIDLESLLKKRLSHNKTANLKYIDNIKYYFSDMKPFMTLLFESNQLNDIKELIIPFVEKFGFPYKGYNNNLSFVKLNDNESIIPCNILIENSIFYYMYYTLYYALEATDKRILDVFDFIPKEKFKELKKLGYFEKKTFFRMNRSNAVAYKDNWIRYNDLIYQDTFMNKDVLLKKDITNTNDSYFNALDKNGFNCKQIFNNLCVAMRILLLEETGEFIPEERYKSCKYCGKKFIPNAKSKKYCSKACSVNGIRLSDNNRKKKNI